MTGAQMWSLMVPLILLAIATSLKSAHDAFLLKKVDKEVTRLISEVESLKKTHNEAIPGIQERNAAVVDKLSAEIERLSKETSDERKDFFKPIEYDYRGIR